MTPAVTWILLAITAVSLVLPPAVASSSTDAPAYVHIVNRMEDARKKISSVSPSSELQSGIEECRRGAYQAAKEHFVNALSNKQLPTTEQNEINGWLSFATNMLGEDSSRNGVQPALQPDKLNVFLVTCDPSEFDDYQYFLPKFYPDESQTKKLLAEREALLPADHPLIAQSYRYLAHILWFKGEKRQAKDCLLKAVRSLEHSLGSHDLTVAETYDQISCVSIGIDGTDPEWLTYKEQCNSSLTSIQPAPSDALSTARLLLTKARVAGGWILQNQDESVRLCKEALKALDAGGANVLWKTLVFNALAQIYQMGQSYETARSSLQQSLDAWKSTGGYPLDTAFAYNRLGEICSFTGDKKGSFANYENALKYYLKVFPETSACAARLSYQLAKYSTESEDKKKLLVEDAVEKLKKACGENSPETAAALKTLAYYEAKANPGKAQEHMTTGLANEKKHSSAPSDSSQLSVSAAPLDDANKIFEQCLLKLQMGQYAESDQLYRQYMSQFRMHLAKMKLIMPMGGPSLSYFQRMFLELMASGAARLHDFKRTGTREKDFADVWGNWEFPLVEELLKKLEQRKQDGDVRAMVETELELALLLQFQSYKIKTPFAINALDQLKKQIPLEKGNTALGVDCLMAACILAAAEEIAPANEAANLAIATIKIENASPQVIEMNIDLSNNAAEFFLRNRNLASARNACDLSIALSKQLKSEGHLARSYALSAKIASQQSDVSVANEHAALARQYAKAQPSLQSLALEASIKAAQSCEALQEAEKYATELLNILKADKNSGDNLPSRDLMATQTMLAAILASEGKFKESEDVLNSIDLTRAPNPSVEESFECFTAMYECRAQLSLHEGKMLEARNQLLSACGWPEDAARVLQQKPYDAWLQDINTISLIDVKNGQPEVAAQTVQKSAALMDSFIQRTFDQMSFSEQCAFVAALKRQFDGLLTFGTRPEVIASSYGYLVRWKAMLVEALKRQAEAEHIAQKRRPDLVEKSRKIESDLSSMQSATKIDGKGSAPTSGAEWCLRHQELCAKLEQCQREMAALVPSEFGKSETSDKTVEQLQKALSSGSCLIDTYVYTPVGQEKPHYGVFVLLANVITFHDLGECAVIDSKVHGLLDAIRARAPVDLARGTRDVSNKQVGADKEVDWSLLQGLIANVVPKNTEQIFLCMDGELALIPPAVLFPEDTKVSQLDNARQLIDGSSSQSVFGTGEVLLVGDVDFSGYLPQLPFTKTESERIAALARQLKLDVVELNGGNATKSSVRKELPKAVVAHIATHGFFEGKQPAIANTRSAFTQPMSVAQLAELARNPLLQSGLVFANDPGSHGSQRLTAEEIATLDLSNCDLVTLSACETGRGRAYSGQGIVGLRSCLVSSGAKRLLISLWSVDDEATSALMSEFYNQLWINKQPPHKAFALAQQKVKSEKKWAHPFYWAGWVLLGN